ncbi:MAG: L-seryl-tRNA(Sec) selenium transferase [Acidobacteria bacterium]|nr:L-seryl-tRNA(Sec) selenium transferase [Acidobacteriota bacterium]
MMSLSSRSQLYRKLPSIDELMRSPALAALLEREGQPAVADAIRFVLASLRDQIAAGNLETEAIDIELGGLEHAVRRRLRDCLSFSLRPLVNATGVILHTNLGRAPIAAAALEHLRHIAGQYSNLEFDIDRGQRGEREVHVERLFRRILADQGFRAEEKISTLVVNNNAAAVLVALNTLAEGGEVIVSRGELVEIGGSFRIPEVMAKSGAVLREVGTTNRTRVSDYERAINEKTRLLLRVHRSNFQITGFTEQPPREELAALSQSRSLPLMEDLGSGALFELRTLGIRDEPGVAESLAAGVELVTYSGDKLLGGPQAGLISGHHSLVARIRSNPLFRALRVDKLTYATLEATLLAYVKRDFDAIPALRMMHLSEREIGDRAQHLLNRVSHPALQLSLHRGESLLGGGAAPSATLATRLLAVTSEIHSADELAAGLRAFAPPIIARVEEGRVLIDLRTVFPEQDEHIALALNQIARTRAADDKLSS